MYLLIVNPFSVYLLYYVICHYIMIAWLGCLFIHQNFYICILLNINTRKNFFSHISFIIKYFSLITEDPLELWFSVSQLIEVIRIMET